MFKHISELEYHELAGLLYKNSKALEQRRQKTLLINTLLLSQFFKINKGFQEHGITILPIKGVSLLLSIYKDMASRPMNDIDLLIEQKNVDRGVAILKDMGYRLDEYAFSEDYYYLNYCHIPLFKEADEGLTYTVELHWSLAVPRPYKIGLPLLWTRIRSITVDDKNVKLLSHEDDIFSLLLHLRRFDKPLSLKYILDISEILKKYRIDWDYIYKHSRSNRLISLAYYALFAAKVFFNNDIKDETINRFYPGFIRASLLKYLVNRASSYGVSRLQRSIVFRKIAYVFLRFLLYDRALDFIKFVLIMPKEEFCRFFTY
ncbi:MAG: nucleotidyltransferase family protein [Candidatus Omnitrophica bacterium]|nr:nucleotidyltransferase family protein [Candidatus Omnitrophota bacterium]